MLLSDMVEQARKLPFDSARTQFEGIADLIGHHPDLVVYRDALAQFAGCMAVFDRVRDQLAAL